MTAATARLRSVAHAQVDEPPRFVDAALAAGLAIFAQLDLRFNLDNSTHYGSGFAASAVVAVATLALAWRRRHPLATLLAVVGAIAVPELFTQLTVTLWGHFVPLLLATYALARWCESRRGTAVGVAVALASLVVLMLRVPALGTAANIPFAFVPIITAAVGGQVLQRREARHHELAAHAWQLEAARGADRGGVGRRACPHRT